MTIISKNERNIAVAEPDIKISNTQDMLDLFANAHYLYDATDIVIYKESLCDDFFDLKTRIAGELLQKCSNYHVRLAIVGDFSGYTSQSLRDFIYESNKGNLTFFKSDLDSALAALC